MKKEKSMKKWMLCIVLLVMLPALACSFSLDLGGETPAADTPLPTQIPTEPSPTTPPPALAETPTMAPSPTQAVPSGVLLKDDFSDPNSGWEQLEFDDGAVGYTDGAYFVLSRADGKNVWGMANRSFDNLTIEVEATQISAPANNNNAYGVGCRTQSNGQGYYFYVSGDGYYRLAKAAGGDHQPLVDWTASDIINQGNATNLIRAVCNRSHLALFVNGQLLVEADDPTFQVGDIAMSVATLEADPTEVHFDNVLVTVPTSAPEPVASPTQAAGILMEDDFDNPRSGWEVAEYDSGSMGYGDGFYFVTSIQSGTQNWGVANQSFTDVVVDVDTEQVSGPANDNNAYGLVCRVQSNGDGYALRVSGDGFCAIHKISDGNFEALADWTESEAVRQGNATNQLRAVCDGSDLALFVNGELVAQATDTTFAVGDLALTATTFEEESTEVHFDNLVARAPAPR
jgi:hypothetical protein